MINIINHTILGRGIFIAKDKYLHMFDNINNVSVSPFVFYIDELDDGRDVFICMKNKTYEIDTCVDIYKEIDFSLLSLNDDELIEFANKFNQIPPNNLFMYSVSYKKFI